jgi:hypothetical protein
MPTTNQPPPPQPVNLARLATIFAAVFVVAFGLCAVGFATTGFGSQRAASILPVVVLGTEAICLLGLLVTGIWAIIRSIRSAS